VAPVAAQVTLRADQKFLFIMNQSGLNLDQDRLQAVQSVLDRYTNEGKLPGCSCLVSQDGVERGWFSTGLMDVERQRPLQRDTLFRIYSMTKPLTSVAIMQLYEQGELQLDDPVSRFMPEWKDVAVFRSGTGEEFKVEATHREVTIKDLLTHTAGLTYGFQHHHVVDERYRALSIDGANGHGSAEQRLDRLVTIPLLFQPGSRWNYSVATDVLGYLVTLISGMGLDQYIERHITGPLGMRDTGFIVPDSKLSRFAACYQASPEDVGDGRFYALQDDPESSPFRQPPEFLSGGGGMVSSVDDYHRFCLAMLGRGQLDGVRVLGAHTAGFMTLNHLPGNVDLSAMGQAVFSETPLDGIGFGLGFSVVLDPVRTNVLCSKGEFAWGGMASTAFWIDPVLDIVVIFMTQLLPSSTWPIRRELRTAVYQALV